MESADESSKGGDSLRKIKDLLSGSDPAFFEEMKRYSALVTEFGQAYSLHTLRRRAAKSGLLVDSNPSVRIGIVGGATLRPLADLIEHFLSIACEAKVEAWLGEFDSYVSELTEEESMLFSFHPDFVIVLPSESRCRYFGLLSDPISEQRNQANQVVDELVALCSRAHEICKAEIVCCNYRLPARFDPGPMRASCLGSDYAFRKYVNQQLGMCVPAYVHICDVEFLSNRIGTLRSSDDRAWFESKQPYSSELVVQVARECAHVISHIRKPVKKVIVVDLDNTLWGGVVGDDGVEGIEIGATSSRGEAFRGFQTYLRALSKRGILLAICSKNEYDKAIEPLEVHPEMVLRLADFVCIKANWEPKSENIRAIASELNLGLDSFVFLDDNPAEVEIVRQFLPDVTAICVGDDPSTFVATLQDSRLFETSSLTVEDLERGEQYRQESLRKLDLARSTDMESYLASLEMVADVSSFVPIDVPRIAQLINKSNQFNLTTRRRTETEVRELIGRPDYSAFTVRLSDRFGDHGLIAIVIGKIEQDEFEIDTWLMSCRVLKRGVEVETLREIVLRAESCGCRRIVGSYIPSSKNAMVRDHYLDMGFTLEEGSADRYWLIPNRAPITSSFIHVKRRND